MEELNVLLVDDEVEFASALAERLALRGVRVRTASRGEEALRLLEEELPQVVVLDLMMPGLGGKETLRIILSRYPRIRVILLSGHGAVGGSEEGLRLGAWDCLIKPVNIDELLGKLREAVR